MLVILFLPHGQYLPKIVDNPEADGFGKVHL